MDKDYRSIEYISIKRKFGNKEFTLNYNGSYIDNLVGPSIIGTAGEYQVFYEPGWGAANRIIFNRTGLQHG